MLKGKLKAIATIPSKGAQTIFKAAEKFWDDDAYGMSAALTFYSIQSFVPFLALILGISKGFGFEDYFQKLTLQMLPEQREAINYAFNIAQAMLQDIKGKVVVGMGVVILVWTAVNLLSSIENSLNKIWRVITPRTFFRKLSDYLAAVVICPILLIVLSSMNVYIQSQIGNFEGTFLQFVSTYLLLLFKLAPLVLSWILFFLLYAIMPNNKVAFWPRAVAGIFAGSIFMIWQWLYIKLQVTIFNYSAVYGAFAAIPLLLIWLQFSWVIALAGAELSAQIEREGTLQKSIRSRHAHLRKVSNKKLGLLVLYQCLEAFYHHKQPPDMLKIAEALNVPSDIVQKILDIFTEDQILAAMKSDEGVCYLPFSDPNNYTINDICDIIDSHLDLDIAVVDSKPYQKISNLLEQLEKTKRDSKSNVKLSSLIQS